MKSTPLRKVGGRSRESDHAPQQHQQPQSPAPGASRPGGPRRARLVVELVVAIVVTGVLALFEVEFVLAATGLRAVQNTSRGGLIAGAVVFAGFVALATRWVIAIEHRLRGDQPVARSFRSTSVSRRRRRYSPVTQAVLLVFIAGATAGCIVGAVKVHQQGERSSYTQSHGIQTNAIVDAVNNTQYCGRYGCNWTSAILVSPLSPVDGVTTTTVHYDAYSSLMGGQQVQVLVDPNQPNYAELPGDPFTRSYSWIVFAGLALLFGWLTVLDLRGIAKQLAHRRAHRAGRLTPQH
jgi:hypothetical protein